MGVAEGTAAPEGALSCAAVFQVQFRYSIQFCTGFTTGRMFFRRKPVPHGFAGHY
ncbi:hypothetical protein [Caldanaerobacter subterraneus]|uniref:hypothetical protein n=1 Tax=Caldanaerobacter subterraneus TaxID=911092 RepID=UPI001378C692|nr:hypothetical protein [Caldanaerobacter subterraneus]